MREQLILWVEYWKIANFLLFPNEIPNRIAEYTGVIVYNWDDT